MPRSLLLLALVPLSACYPETRKDGSSGRPSADVDTDTDSDTDTDADSDTDTDTDTDPPPFIDYTTADGGTMVAITAGTFEMGSADYGPVHTVTLTHDFWIGQTEVTQAQYLAGTGASPSYFSGCGGTCPVEQVSWEDAAAYANALSASEGLELCYTAAGGGLAAILEGNPYMCAGYRLPTEGSGSTRRVRVNPTTMRARPRPAMSRGPTTTAARPPTQWHANPRTPGACTT